MAQQQHRVALVFLDGSEGEAAATGNNAAWTCRCGFDLPLVARTGLVGGGLEERYLVDCPACTRTYTVIPEGGDWGRVERVQEVDRAEIGA